LDLQTIIEKAHIEWKENPRKAEEELEVISRYGNMFNPKNIYHLTAENFKSFLNYRNNKHWIGLERQGSEITQDIEKLRKTLKLLLDETIPIDQRIKRIRDKNSPEYHKGLGSAYYTPVLLVVYPNKYPVINKIVKDALQRTGIYHDYDSKPEWMAYAEVIPKILELAEKNHLSLWQMDSVWWNLYAILDYEGLYNFITKIMDAKTTYQPIMIRTLLEKGIASKEVINEQIRLENPAKENDFVSHELYEVLVDKHKIVKVDENGYKLNLVQPLSPIERNKLIELCNQEIIRIRESHRLLEKNVSAIHLDILKKYYKKRGKYLKADEIYGEKKTRDIKKSPLPPDEIVNEPHYMHNLITGVYWPSGDEYALSIQLNPKSKWELEIDRSHPTLRINYDFGPNPIYKSQISKLENCYKNDVPIGIIFKTIKAKNKILGLGKIVSFNSTKFVIDSYGISEEESKILKEETIKEFDESLSDPEFSKIEEVNYNEFLSEINFNNDKFKHTIIKSPEPRRIRINQIIEHCDSGEWVIPRFQRYFDWKKEDIRDFLKSIVLDYYVGSLLLWDVRRETELDIMPINGVNPNQNLIKNAIVLDGQQRITSLYYAIKAPTSNFAFTGDSKGQHSYFYIDFSEFLQSNDYDNLIKVFYEKIEDEESYKKLLFPLYNLGQHAKWVYGLEYFLRKKEGLDQEKILELRMLIDTKLGYIYNGFEIPYVILPSDRSLEQVTDIFEKINSSGIQLDVFDLLIARLSKYGIKLRDMWDESLKYPKIKEYEIKKTAKKMPIYILQSIALCFSKSKSCKRKDILDIYRNVATTKEDFETKWKEMAKYTLEAIDLLENTKHGFGVTVPTELPFEPMIPVLTSLLKEINDKFKDNQKKCFDKLTNWYWTSVFSVAYSSGVDSKKTADFKEMIEWFSNDKSIPKSIKKFRNEYSRIDLRSVEQESNAIYRGVLCLIAIKGGYDFDKNRSIGNKKYNKDHIFPKSKFSDYENINSILNITWLTSDTNQRIKRAKSISTFLEDTIREKYDQNEKEFLKTLDSHLINSEAYKYLKENNFEKFINEREKTILSLIGEKIGADIEKPLPSMTSPQTPYTNIRIIRNAIESCKEYVYYIDKYFAVSDLDIMIDAIKKADIKEVKILISLRNADERMRDNFKRFRDEIKNMDMTSEMRVVVDSKIYREYHDRWILSSNINYNSISGDIAKRGQYAEIKPTENRPPFKEWWQKSLDIVSCWNDINRHRANLANM
jgi:hypothetical protein